MNALEDDNPFDQDGDNILSETSSTSKLDLSEPPSPPSHTQHSPSLSRPFPSPGSHRQPQSTSKSEFCCTRDRVLHSGDDIEILVRELISPLTALVFKLGLKITDAQKTSVGSNSPYIAYVIRTGVWSFALSLLGP